jgi:hypothetical protein
MEILFLNKLNLVPPQVHRIGVGLVRCWAAVHAPRAIVGQASENGHARVRHVVLDLLSRFGEHRQMLSSGLQLNPMLISSSKQEN